MTAEAPVVTLTQGAGGYLITVLCPHCRRRHRHHWADQDQPPGFRQSHCKNGKRQPYEIGEVPSDFLLTASAELQRAAGYLHRTAWIDRFQIADVVVVAEAARVLAAAVDTAIHRMK
jgi:hypothetical protein